jgi:hypothetical protein
VSLGEVWSGVSLALRAWGKSVEKVFTVEPGADASRIRMRVNGAKALRLGGDGSLLVATGLGEIRLTAPFAYQGNAQARRTVSVKYRLKRSAYGFELGDYDPRLPLVIDPLLQSTYLGGGDDDVGYALAIHPTSGEVYVAGYTRSTDFPGTAGGAQSVYGGGAYDVFVARLNANLTTLSQVTYLGGSGDDLGYALAIHPASGEVYVAGFTSSIDFPKTAGGAQPAYGGGASDVFVARLNANLTTLSQATYLGGSEYEYGYALAIHPASGEIYVAGFTLSYDFPKTAGGAQPAHDGDVNAFVARLDANLTTLFQTTYLGDVGINVGRALAIHPTSGEIYVAGYTNSTSFPKTAGGAQPRIGGVIFDFRALMDAFVARLSADLTTLSQATYLGGSGDDYAFTLAIHPLSGEVYVAGRTGFTFDLNNFPKTAGGAQPAFGGGASDAFVARLNANLTTLSQATYLGGSGSDDGRALAIHPTSGEVSVAGSTTSTNFPGTAGGAQPAYGGGASDAFVVRLNANLTALSQASYLGGSGSEGVDGLALAIHPTSGEVYLAGSTTSTNVPKTAGGAQPAYGGGGGDGFVARLTASLAAGACVADATSLCLNGGRFKVRARWMTSDGRGGTGQAVGVTGDTGLFWFFTPNNVEIFVKVVTGCGFNSRIWTFAAGLTNVNVVMDVTDTQSGAVKTYVNPQGTAFAPIQDTDAFACSAATAGEGLSDEPAAASGLSAESDPTRAAPDLTRPFGNVAGVSTSEQAACTADPTTLCLDGGRFKVQTQWSTSDGRNGVGQAVLLTAETGYFWFFSSNNVEVIVKVVSGCAFNARYWTFAGGLTNVNVVTTVTDTQTGAVKTYVNPQGTAFAPIQDTAAFATCP